MAKKNCPAGTKWDKLLVTCVRSALLSVPRPRPKPQPKATTEPSTPMGVHRATEGPATQSDALVSPAMWVSVVVVINGSILALVLWVVIYNRQARHRSTAGDPEPGRTSPAKAQPLSIERHDQADGKQREMETPPSLPPQLYGGGVHRDPRQDGAPGTCAGAPQCVEALRCSGASLCGGEGPEVGGRGAVMCSVVREHGIPLPATELGGSALVTTKTM